ncbi:phytanoyl-CoA dioxygenase family protein [Modestobacter sp. NPDC049651]|uniref:phytanoyl-CoA dioxygenase family protein n=1 Tax=unclassified Modestobacter TaxID=2643866 RepID=UPI0033DC7345
MTTTTPVTTGTDAQAMRDTIYTDGIVGVPGAFSTEWADRLREDIEAAYTEARGREGGAIGRGPNRWYVEVHPEQIRGFVELTTHPTVTAVCEAVLGPDYEIVEIGFDIPFPGAKNQPWHRDFPIPEVTRTERRLNSLAINATAVDTEPDMGPFEIAPGTQWDDDESFNHGMFPPKTWYPRFEERAVRKFPKRGDISIRSALTIHRGTKSESDKPRPVLVLGVDAPGAGNGDKHDMAVTKAFWETLPESLKKHLKCPVVDELTPISQKHDIEGLVMGEE